MTLASGLRIVLLPAALLILVGCGDKKDKPAPDNRPLGERIYSASCAGCHGTTGEGDGKAGSRLVPPPTNFKAGTFKYGTSKDAIKKAVREGIHPSAMTGDASLTGENLDAVADYVRKIAGLEGK